IVGFDPRGIGRSAPVVCSQRLVDAIPSPLVTTADGYARLVAHHRALTRDCRKRTGPVYGHVDTLSVAHDMDRLRAALGETTISFYGASYGTLLGAQYAERYPARVRAVALDSVIDHSADTGAFLADGTAAAQDSFDWFVKWCSRYRSCVLRGRDIPALWRTLLARAPVPDPFHPGETLDVFDLLGVAFSSFYDPQWYSLAYFIDAALAPGAGRRAKVAETPYNFPAVFCADWKLPVDGFAGWQRHLATVRAPQMPVSPLAASGVSSCLGRWSAPDNPQRPLKPARVPTLLLASRHDPATPYVWAQRAAAQLGPGAALVTYNGWGHVSYGRSGCTTGVVDRFLIDLRRPTQGVACPGVIPPQMGVG
ncbi:alpha/beta hydrolase, partial [Actinoplanes sp. NPDC051633]|uniref:alpha/beta hydrolase n=1 Tax=Actinoplanes sp. NPDC051633 TaxID=3155670 RepID=UPI00343B7F9D